MLSAQNYLALDLGAESGRTMVGSLASGILSLAETHRFVNQPLKLPSGLHWDIASLWKEIKKGIAISSSQFQLESLAIDTWGVDFALLDETGTLLDIPFHYRDSRTDGMLQIALQRLSREYIFAQTGIQFMQLNTLYQLLAMLLNQDPSLAAAETFLTIPDLLNHWLCGSLCCEFTNATTTQCFNPITRTWASPLLEALGIPTHIFPPLCEPGTVLGSLPPVLVAETGAPPLPVIAPACHDTGSAVVAIPAQVQDFAWLSSGTWSIMGAEVLQPCLTPQALAYNFTNEGGVFGTWRLSKNIMGLWIIQECRRAWESQGTHRTYAQLTQLASAAKPFLAVIDPDAQLFFHPGDMPSKVIAYCAESGQAIPKTEGEIVRLVLESLALKYSTTLQQLEQLVGRRLDPIHIIGGGSQNDLLNQLTADCTGRTVIAGPVEATAIGNVLLQSIALGHLGSLPEARALVRRSFAVKTFHPTNPGGWDTALKKLHSLSGFKPD